MNQHELIAIAVVVAFIATFFVGCGVVEGYDRGLPSGYTVEYIEGGTYYCYTGEREEVMKKASEASDRWVIAFIEERQYSFEPFTLCLKRKYS